MAWISGNRYLSEAEMQNNADIVIDVFRGMGIPNETIAALLANMQSESTINPGLYEVGGSGYGLVQWTPQSDLINACAYLGLSPYSDGYVQLEVIPYEIRNEIPGLEQWYSSAAFINNYATSGSTSDMIGVTGAEFLANSMGWPPEKLTVCFMVCYERPAYSPSINHSSQRQANAAKWYEYIGGSGSYSAVVENAVTWAIGIAEDDSHGYSQASRDGPDYDCSSLVCWAYYNAGLNTRPGYTPSTHVMYGVFTAAGFIDVTGQCDLGSGSGMRRGDVLLNVQNHTAMYIGDGMMVQASSNRGYPQVGDQTGTEIWTCVYRNYPWDYVLRYPETETRAVSIVRFIPG